MLDKKRHQNDEKQFKFLQEGSNRILSKAQILLVLSSHELLSTLHTTHQLTYFKYSFHQIQFKFLRISRIHPSYQVNKIGDFVVSYFNLNLHLNLNIKARFSGEFTIYYIPT